MMKRSETLWRSGYAPLIDPMSVDRARERDVGMRLTNGVLGLEIASQREIGKAGGSVRGMQATQESEAKEDP